MSLDLNLRTQTISSKCPGQTFMGLSSKLQQPSHKLSKHLLSRHVWRIPNQLFQQVHIE